MTTIASNILTESKQLTPAPGLTSFNFGSTMIRTTVDDGTPWFHAGDVCAILEFGNPRQALARLDEDEKGVRSMDTLGGTQLVNFISESGLYALILGSRKPEAKKFKRWVTAEVLPALRKTGTFSVKRMSTPPTLTELLLVQDQRGIEQDRQLEALIRQQGVMDAKLDDISRVLGFPTHSQRDLLLSQGDATIFETAWLLGVGGLKLFKFLQLHGVLSTKAATRNQPAKKYVDLGYFINVRETYGASAVKRWTEVLVTPKGRQWLNYNACRGWLDGILDRQDLAARAAAVMDLPLPVRAIDPNRP